MLNLWKKLANQTQQYMLLLVAKSWSTLLQSMDCSLQAILSMGLLRQEYYTSLPCPSGDLPSPGSERRSPALQEDSLSSELPGKHTILKYLPYNNNFSFSGHCYKYKAQKIEVSKTHLRFLILFDRQLFENLSENNIPSVKIN